jgi:hypothetical protein
MGLHPGTKLGNYEIVAPLGMGGMGEVYRARDLSLQREAAVWIEPPPRKFVRGGRIEIRFSCGVGQAHI